MKKHVPKIRYSKMQILGIFFIIISIPMVFFYSGFLLLPLYTLIEVIFKPTGNTSFYLTIVFSILKIIIGFIGAYYFSIFLWPDKDSNYKKFS